MDTNEVVRSTIIWSLEETLKKKDAEIERLREALIRILDPMNFEKIFDIAVAALQQNRQKVSGEK